LPGAIFLLSQSNIAFAEKKSNFDGFDIFVGASTAKLKSSNTLNDAGAIDVSGNYISDSDYSYEEEEQIFNYGLSYTHSLNTNFNISYILDFSPNKITTKYVGVGKNQIDEISKQKKISLQIGYLLNPDLQIGFKAGLAKADSKNSSDVTEEHNLNGKSLGVTVKKKLQDNLFLNFEYGQTSFDKNNLNIETGGFLFRSTTRDNEFDLKFFTIGISYKFK
jgi:opacity protein-like surface antigen